MKSGVQLGVSKIICFIKVLDKNLAIIQYWYPLFTYIKIPCKTELICIW